MPPSLLCVLHHAAALDNPTTRVQTTLMDVLAGRKTVGTITGDIRLNGGCITVQLLLISWFCCLREVQQTAASCPFAGFPKNQATFARVSGYCEQTGAQRTTPACVLALQGHCGSAC